MKRLICWFKAIPLWLRSGYFVPHLYESAFEDAIIIATEKGFRVSDNYKHTADETVYPNAVLERCRCIYCGHETQGWYTSKKAKEEMER